MALFKMKNYKMIFNENRIFPIDKKELITKKRTSITPTSPMYI